MYRGLGRVMNKFMAIKSVWEDLELAYSKDNSGGTRMDFAKRLVNYDGGTAGIRALLKIVQESSAGEESEEVIELCSRITNAAENLQRIISAGDVLHNLNTLCKVQKISLNDFRLTTVNNSIPSEEAYCDGTLLPIDRVVKDGTVSRFKPRTVDGYRGVFYDREPFKDFVMMCEGIFGWPSASDFIRTMQAVPMQYPVIVAEDSVLSSIKKHFRVKKLCDGKVAAFDVTDSVGTTRVLVVYK